MFQSQDTLGEVTEALHAWIRSGWQRESACPVILEDLAETPHGEEPAFYVLQYRVEPAGGLSTPRNWRLAHLEVPGEFGTERFLERPPIFVDVYFLVAVHARFRSEAERLLGWVLLRLCEASHLVDRPRAFTLPDGRRVASDGLPLSGAESRGALREKIGLAWVQDLRPQEAVGLFSAHRAPFRPHLTFRARASLAGALRVAQPTTIRRSLEPAS